ncbi:hypothetical protein D3C71_1736420 [compost metagenome]
MTFEVRQVDGRPRQQRMSIRQHADLVHFQQQLDPRAGRCRVVLGQAQVVALRGQPFLQQGRFLRFHRQAHPGMPAMKPQEGVGQDGMGKRRQRDHRELSAPERP